MFSDTLSKTSRSSPGWGTNINLRMSVSDNKDIADMLKIRTKEEFEKIYRVELNDDAKWKTFSTRAAAILQWVASRKGELCEVSEKLH